MRGSDGRNGKNKRPLWAFLPFCSELPRKQILTNPKNATLLSVAGLPPPRSLNNPLAAKRPKLKSVGWWRKGFRCRCCFSVLRFAVGVVKGGVVSGFCPGRVLLQKIKAVSKTHPPFFVACLFVVCNQTAHGTRQAVKDCFCKLPYEQHGQCNKPAH